MARTNATNFTGGLQFPYATAAADIFKKEDVQVLAQAVDQHDHSSGKGLVLSAAAIPAGLITSAMIADGTIAAADLNAALGNFGAGVAWTPSISQGGAGPTLTVILATYIRLGKIALVCATFTITGAGAALNDIVVTSNPVVPRATSGALGSFIYTRAGTGFYAGTALIGANASQIKFVAGGSDGTNLLAGYLGNAQGPSFAMANNDSLMFTLFFEAA